MTTPDRAAPAVPTSVLAPLLVGAALVVPPFVLEWFNRRMYHEELPLVLFAFMSVHALVIAFALTPAFRRLHAERRLRALRLGHWAGLLVGAVLVYAYAGVVSDQLPCFLGVPNCD
jgi:hypothetical protein